MHADAVYGSLSVAVVVPFGRDALLVRRGVGRFVVVERFVVVVLAAAQPVPCARCAVLPHGDPDDSRLRGAVESVARHIEVVSARVGDRFVEFGDDISAPAAQRNVESPESRSSAYATASSGVVIVRSPNPASVLLMNCPGAGVYSVTAEAGSSTSTVEVFSLVLQAVAAAASRSRQAYFPMLLSFYGAFRPGVRGRSAGTRFSRALSPRRGKNTLFSAIALPVAREKDYLCTNIGIMADFCIREVRETTPPLLDAFAALMPQLSAGLEAPSAAALERIVRSPSAAMFAAWRDGAAVGALTLVWYDVPSGRKGWIEDVVVDASARGAGVGEALVRAALERAAREGVERVMLTSRPARPGGPGALSQGRIRGGGDFGLRPQDDGAGAGADRKDRRRDGGNELAEEAGEQAAGLLSEAGRQMEKPKSSASDER